jgi:hypothetical protein
MIGIALILIAIAVLLWEISYNIKAINNNLIELMKMLDRKL